MQTVAAGGIPKRDPQLIQGSRQRPDLLHPARMRNPAQWPFQHPPARQHRLP